MLEEIESKFKTVAVAFGYRTISIHLFRGLEKWIVVDIRGQAESEFDLEIWDVLKKLCVQYQKELDQSNYYRLSRFFNYTQSFSSHDRMKAKRQILRFQTNETNEAEKRG